MDFTTWADLSLKDRFRVTCAYPGLYSTPFVAGETILKNAKCAPIHGKFMPPASASQYWLFMSFPVIGSGSRDRSGFWYTSAGNDLASVAYSDLRNS